MAETGLTRFPVVSGNSSGELVGMAPLNGLLQARTRSLREERHRERAIRIRMPFGKRGAAVKESETA